MVNWSMVFENFRMETMLISCKNKDFRKIIEKTIKIEHFCDIFRVKLILSF